MKQIISTLVLFFILAALGACFDDESSIGTSIRKIEIGELRDTMIVSYSGNRLIREPIVVSDYAEENLSYAWYIFDNKYDDFSNDGLPEGFRDSLLTESKCLDYEVNLEPGAYTFVVEVTAPDGYCQTASMQLSVTTNFSDGFYVLKETANGSTELDIITKEGMVENLLTSRLGSPLQGSPKNLAVIYYQSYIDESTQDMSAGNFIHLFTDSDYCGLRSDDLNPVFDRTNLLFDELGVDEYLYGMVQNSNNIYCLSNKGVRDVRTADSPSAGKFGFEAGTGASRYMQMPLDGSGIGAVYWEEKEHHLYTVTWSGATPLEYILPMGVDEKHLDCLACGSYFSETYKMTVWFLCKDEVNGKRYLYLVEDELSGEVTISLQEIAASDNLAQAMFVSGNTFDGTLIYALCENKLFGYSYGSQGGEFEIELKGIGEGEILTYVSNAFINLPSKPNSSFNYLMVGTQKGDEYKLYFYDDLVGGAPKDEPIRVETGTGVLKNVRYVSSAVTYDDMRGSYASGPVFPVCD